MEKRIKAWIVVVFFLFPVYLGSTDNLPSPKGFINDFARIIVDKEEERLARFFSELERQTTAEICIVTVKTTAPLDIETFAVELFEKWGIGKKGKDNGVLFLVAVEDRKMRIEVGYGLEGAIPDAVAARIIRDITPYFRKGEYTRGIVMASYRLADRIAEEYGVDLNRFKGGYIEKRQPDLVGIKKGEAIRFLLSLLFLFLFLGIRGLFLGGSYYSRRGYWYGVGYGGFSGGFSGGFGGFGGGLSGGGGASGGW